MADYNLLPNEVVLLKAEGVARGKRSTVSTDDLILTNLHLVLVQKGFFGKSKGVLTFPLREVKVYNGQAQAIVGKASLGQTPKLEVYFMNGQEEFDFQGGGKKKVIEWASKINEVVTGTAGAQIAEPSLAIPGADVVADTIKDTVNVFKNSFGFKSKNAAPEKVAGKCSACGAPITGLRGQTTTCEYCGSAQQL